MIFRLLSTGRGVPLSLAPEKAVPLHIQLEGAPRETSFWMKNGNGAVNYFTVKDGVCDINVSTFGGNVTIGAISTAGGVPARWDCGTLCIFQTPRGLFAAPGTADLAEQVRELTLQNDSLAAENRELKRLMEELERKFNEFYEGYDFI